MANSMVQVFDAATGENIVRTMTDEELIEMQSKKPNYRTFRAAEYPPMADYLDGIVKGDQAQVQTYIDACLAVKAKYPKPE